MNKIAKRLFCLLLAILMLFSVISVSADNTELYSAPTRILSQKSTYMKGNDVKWVQSALNNLGYSLKVDGYYGPLTYNAVKAFQKAYGLEADGKVGGETVTKLFAVATEGTKLEKILAFARSQLGSSVYNGYCQKFVRHAYQAAGIYQNVYVGSAIEAYSKWCISTNRYNIPVGATLYFKSSSVYGHVGIYTGNGNMIHGASTVREEKISDYWWNNFLGWGYQGGKAPY